MIRRLALVLAAVLASAPAYAQQLTGGCVTIGTTPVCLGAAATTITGLTLSGGTLSGTTTLTGMTAGSVPFVGASSVLSQDNVNLFWNSSLARLNVNTARITGFGAAEAAGAGVEIAYGAIAASGTVFSFDRTAGIFKPLIIQGLPLIINDTSGGNVGIGISPAAGLSLHVYRATGSTIALDSPAAQNRNYQFRSAGVLRWSIIANNTAEGGSNAGSDINWNAYADAGTYASTPITMIRSTGRVGIQNLLPQAMLTIGTTAGTARIYNSFTDASNGEWAYLGSWGPLANVATFGTDKNGSGTTRNIQFYVGGTTKLEYGIANAGAWTLSDNLFTNASVIAGNNLRSGTSSNIQWGSTRSIMQSPSDGVILLLNAASSDFSRLQFGGTSASFPALKRSSTTLQARLADDSTFANIQGKLTTEAAYAVGVTVPTGSVLIYDSTGVAYKVSACLASGC